MCSVKKLFNFIILRLVIASPQINLYLTDWTSNNNNNNNNSDAVFRHDCLHVAASIENEIDFYHVISYCLTEWSSTWNISQNNHSKKLTFAELYKKNITSQQLYLWSAPMDVVERYQIYLNQISTLNESSSMRKSLFYNCTSPRFGPQCQYSLNNHKSYHLSLNEIIYEFYQDKYDPINLTCYTHLKCNRGSTLICLDWTEICDGTLDCQDGIDEESCWQLQINKCKDDEYQCFNGQCISKTFFHDDSKNFECLDQSDGRFSTTTHFLYLELNYLRRQPTFENEDIVCPLRHGFGGIKWSSSCRLERSNIIRKLLFDDIPNVTSHECWTAVKCQFEILTFSDPICHSLCFHKTCKEIINETCPDMLNIPSGTLAFGHIFFVYTKADMILPSRLLPSPRYVCYNDQLCDALHPNKSFISFNNATCRHPKEFPLKFGSSALFRGNWYKIFVLPIYEQLSRCNKISYDDYANFTNEAKYKCINSSKYISKYQLCDGINNCDYYDDEKCPIINGSCSIYGFEKLFTCEVDNRCISPLLLNNFICDCVRDQYGMCDDENLDIFYSKTHISFSTICDGFTELTPIIIDGRNETDETECEYWQCNNTYTRCNGIWNCLNGADEVDCNSSSSLLNCSSHHHLCVSLNTSQLVCLPLEKANDGNIDCVGGTDEPKLCRSNDYIPANKSYYCNTDQNEDCISFGDLYCSSNCKPRSNGQFCDRFFDDMPDYKLCDKDYKTLRSDVENFFCARQNDTKKEKIINFSLDKSTKSTQQLTNTMISYSSIRETTIDQFRQLCHRGLPLRVWLDDQQNLSTIACLCPPSFYGDMCQYQNQRVSLTMRFEAFSDSRRTLFALIVSLIDDSNERIIHSYQQFTYLYIRDCQKKFNIYLLYSTRPKHLGKNYSLHIDIYEKISLTYRSSMIIPIKFSFLPVYRSAVHLTIPGIENNKENCLDFKCVNGQCMRYSNNQNYHHFCQCYQGWLGKYCTIPYKCTCSPDSLCVGISSNNRSICVCPLNKWGSQCYLHNTICNSDNNVTCYNNGQCIPIDENIASTKQFVCICRKGFGGERCEIVYKKTIVSFHEDINLPEKVFIHFIRLFDNAPPENDFTFTTIRVNQNSINIQWSRPFHIAFLKIFRNYYLITVQKMYNQSTTINRKITLSDRCKHLNEILNETIINLHLLRRIKYYHLACQKHSPSLSCFYDNTYFCLCTDYGNQRLANCFEFNSSIEHNCFGQSNCENGAQCLQDRISCPQTSMCICSKCFHGTRCQFSSNLLDLSFDALLGYHIQLHTNIKHQPSIIQFSVALTTIMILVGLINSILSIITFKSEEIRKIGCGIYLLTSSIISFITLIIFALKFWILIIAQMSYITNRTFLYVQCVSIDFLLRICITMNQWLNACVAGERVYTIIKGTSFDKNKSKQAAKYIIFALLFLSIGTIIHDPIYRRLLDDYDDNIDENRIWCVVNYSPNLRTFNSAMLIFHFVVPFLVNIASAFTIIFANARQRTTVQTQQTYWKLLREQLQQHYHLLIAPFCLIILALPNIIISFVSICMNPMTGSWSHLIAYLISFIPSMITFLVFVIPSKTYKQALRENLETIRRRR